MPEPQVKALETSVASEAKHDPNAIKLLATQKADETNGPAAAFAYLQHNRQKYDVTLSHARAALTGTPERPASLDSAIESATKAFVNMPDGADVRFVKDGLGGISALVHDVGAKGGERQYNLTPQQFAGIVDITKDGQFDRVMAMGGVEGLLKKYAGGPAIGGEKQQYVGMDGPQYDGHPGARESARNSNRKVQTGYDETLVQAAPQYKQLNPNWGEKAERIDAPIRIKGSGGTPDRTEIGGVDQTPTEQENRLELIRAKNEGRTAGRGGEKRDRMAEIEARNKGALDRAKLIEDAKTARAQAGVGSREKLAADRLMEMARNREAANGRNAVSNAERALVGKIVQGQKLTPDEQNYYNQILQGVNRAPTQPQPQGTAPPNPQHAPQKQVPAQYQAAAEWAKANPTDPRAAKIRKLIGAE
jgi:hypothetical protein